MRKAWKIVDDYRVMLHTPPNGNHGAHEESPTRRSPRMENVYKINIDATSPDYDKWRTGTIIGDSYGVFLVAATWKVSTLTDATIAKALGTRISLHFGLDLSFWNMNFEGNSLNVIKAIRNSNQDQSYFGLIIVDCYNLLALFSSYTINHVKRSANVSTHILVKFVLNTHESIWIEECPGISHSISTDLVAY
ncbi:uncharacterized protein [Cicer arietinum]|uniref:uncharacterized protein n=1 Tax=Cicer arietinum TaxID=3827 RepID=UPI00032A9660